MWWNVFGKLEQHCIVFEKKTQIISSSHIPLAYEQASLNPIHSIPCLSLKLHKSEVRNGNQTARGL